MYTDASDRYLAGVIAQCNDSELKKPVSAQRHEPLAFLRGEFTNPNVAWTTYKKEGYAIVQTFQRMGYLLMCEEPRIYTAHRNLLFCYAPSTMEPTLGEHKVMTLLRWAVSVQYRAHGWRIERHGRYHDKIFNYLSWLSRTLSRS